MDWTAGYTSDIEYTAGFYREQSPMMLNFACALNGYQPSVTDGPFTYFELGFGRGVTASVLAAANPQGSFYAADFNPGHVAGARELAQAAGLANLSLLEASFADLAAGKQSDLPMFDFITLHGIYTWVAPANQAHIVAFIDRYLKPGGVVMISYNAMPGWASAFPLQRLLVEYADAFPGRSDVQLKGASSLVHRMAELKAGYFVANPALKPRLDALDAQNTNYLVHEFMHHCWQPLYHADVARQLAVAKLDYVGSADLAHAYPKLLLNEEKLAVVNSISDAPMRETMKDYFLNTSFRKDIYVRGARKMAPPRQAAYLSGIGLALVVARQDASTRLALPVGSVSGKAALYEPVFDALARRPHTLGELLALPALAGQTLAGVTQIAALLIGSGQAAPYQSGAPAQAREPARRINRALADLARDGDDHRVLCAPLLGSGLAVTHVERLVLLMLADKAAPYDPAQIGRQVWSVLSAQGRRLIKDGVTLPGDDANLAELIAQVERIVQRSLPIWQQLAIL